MSWRCLSDGDVGLAFTNGHQVYGYSLADCAADEDIEEMLAPLFELHPDWKEAFENKEFFDGFCSVCGSWEFSGRDGKLVCAACGTDSLLEIALVPQALVLFAKGNITEDAVEAKSHFGSEKEEPSS